MTRRTPPSWARIALVVFAVGWGANQFSPMLIVYRHALGLNPGQVAGLFGMYAAALIPGLLLGGPLSDRFGRRVCVLPFAALSPAATLLLVIGPRSLALITAGRALAGLCSGMVFGPATAWVQDLSGGDARSSRRAALALTAGFGLGPVAAACFAQWAGDPLVLPYLPHLALGAAALAVGFTVPGGPPARRHAGDGQARGRRRGLPGALRAGEFWVGVALPAPFVFGSVALAMVVLPEEVTSARTLSAGYAGLMTLIAFAAGTTAQPAARRLSARGPRSGLVAGLCAAAAGAAVSAVAVAGQDRALAALGAALLGTAYGLCLVSGLQDAERLSGPGERGTVLAVYYVLAYLGMGAPYAVDGLNSVASEPAALAVVAGAAVAVAGLTLARGGPARAATVSAEHQTDAAYSPAAD